LSVEAALWLTNSLVLTHPANPEGTMNLIEATAASGPTAKEVKAMAIVNSFMGWSAGAGLLPLPVVDLAAIAAVQAKMLQSISEVYGVPFRKNLVKPLIASLISGGGTVLLGATAASLFKGIPLVGSLVGMLAMPAMAAASCYATGKVFIQHFESGGTFLDFDPAKVRAHYAEELAAANEGKT
jgi:uncharacterized protein (DUF697 family)